jgi:DNA polymerase III delta prime subunit
VNQALSLLWVLAESPAAEAEPSKLEQALTYMNSNPYIGWGIAGFVLVAMATAAIAGWTGNLGKIIEFVKTYLWPNRPAITDAQCQAQLKQLSKVVLKEVTERLNQSLHYKIQMDIDRELQMKRVGRPEVSVSSSPSEASSSRLIHRDFNPFESGNSPEPVRDDLPTLKLFQHPDIKGRLLILGEPGAGKTTELLSLAQDLLQQAQQSDEHPIPVLFELSAWSTEPGKTLDDWLIAQLRDRYNVRPEIAKYWIEHHQLLPLLDGLDELRRIDGMDGDTPEELDKQRQYQQIQCLHDINTYLDLHPQTSLAVCCRRQEYEALDLQGEALRRLNGAIYLKSLDDDQIEAYFQKARFPHRWAALKDQPELLELARSPLFLLMLLMVYQGQTITTKSELLDAYITQQLDNSTNRGAYPPGQAPSPEQTDRYLGWLAVKLKEQEMTELFLDHLHPSWLDKGTHISYYLFINILSTLLCIGLFCGLSFGLSVGTSFSFLDGLFSNLTPNLGDYFGIQKFPSEMGFSQRFIMGGRAGFTFGLIMGFLFGFTQVMYDFLTLILMPIAYLFLKGTGVRMPVNFALHNPDFLFVRGKLKIYLSLNQTSLLKFLLTLVLGVVLGLSFGFILELHTHVLSGLSGLKSGIFIGSVIAFFLTHFVHESHFEMPKFPNEFILQTISGSIFSASLIGLLSGLIAGFSINLSSGLLTGFLSALAIAWFSGGNGIIYYFSLRLALYGSGVAPWNYARFLDHAENHRFIQRVGGRYRFVHDLLRTRFAERYRAMER